VWIYRLFECGHRAPAGGRLRDQRRGLYPDPVLGDPDLSAAVEELAVTVMCFGGSSRLVLCEQDGYCHVAPLAPIDGVKLLLTEIANPRYGVWP
jgi:hypothetical protein